MPRSRLIAGFLAVLVPVLAIQVSTRVAAAEPTSQAQGARTLAVSESAGIPVSGATLTVTGSGFDTAVDVYLAICAAGTQPADDLTNCVGGGIPDDNTSASWALVTADTAGKTNAKEIGADGSFDVELTVDAAVGSSVDCVSDGCVLLARSVGELGSRPADITIGLGFVAPTSSSSSTSSTTSSTSTSETPTTRSPDSVALPEAQIGQQQTVVFTGFTANEDVAVTVFSAPVDVPGIKASAGGVVLIAFQVTDALVVGQHTVQAIGAQSGIVGVAGFSVIAAAVTTSSTPTTESSTASSAPTTTSAPVTTTSASIASTTETTSSGAAVPTTPSTSGTNLWWLWVTLILLVVVGGIIAAVAVSRRRAQQLEQERLDREQELADASAVAPPATQGWAPDQPWTGSYNDPSQSHGLMSGREGDGPSLYSGQGSYPPVAPVPPRYEPPTTRISPPPVNPAESDAPTTAWRPDYSMPPGDQPTTAIPLPPNRTPGVTPGSRPNAVPDATPGGTSPDEAAPSTQRWSPFDDDDEDTDGPPPKR